MTYAVRQDVAHRWDANWDAKLLLLDVVRVILVGFVVMVAAQPVLVDMVEHHLYQKQNFQNAPLLLLVL